MNTRIILTTFLLLSAAAGVRADPVLFSGTYKPGSNFTEPRPRKSQYLEVLNGGVVVMEQRAGFYLLAQSRKRFGKPVYATIEYENPADPLRPLINDMVIDAAGGRFDFSSPEFVTGLKINQEYRIVVRIYRAKGDAKPFDTLEQKVRSYVDTTGPELKVKERLKVDAPGKDIPECWDFSFDGRAWTVGHQDGNKSQRIHEYVLEGEKITGWTELVTSHIVSQPVKPRQLFEQIQASLAKDCATLRVSVIEETPDSLIFEWAHGGCGGYPPQHELKRITRTSRGTLMLSYVRKTNRLPDEAFSRWLAILKAAAPSE